MVGVSRGTKRSQDIQLSKIDFASLPTKGNKHVIGLRPKVYMERLRLDRSVWTRRHFPEHPYGYAPEATRTRARARTDPKMVGGTLLSRICTTQQQEGKHSCLPIKSLVSTLKPRIKIRGSGMNVILPGRGFDYLRA